MHCLHGRFSAPIVAHIVKSVCTNLHEVRSNGETCGFWFIWFGVTLNERVRVDAEEGPLQRRSDSDSVPHGIHESSDSLEDPPHWDPLVLPPVVTEQFWLKWLIPWNPDLLKWSECPFMRPLPCGIHRGSVTCVRVRVRVRVGMSRASVRVIQERGPWVQRGGRVSTSVTFLSCLYLFIVYYTEGLKRSINKNVVLLVKEWHKSTAWCFQVRWHQTSAKPMFLSGIICFF